MDGTTTTPARARATPRHWSKRVRRLHMYLGLLMFPWVLLFGITGMLFNHPQVGRDVRGRGLKADEFAALTGFVPWNPGGVAQAVLAELNARSAHAYRLDDTFQPYFEGFTLLIHPSPDGGRDVMILNIASGAAGVAHHPAPKQAAQPEFAGSTLTDTRFTMVGLAQQLEGARAKLELAGAGDFQPHPKVSPELRFRVRDQQGRLFHVSYHVGNGLVDARAADSPPPQRLIEALTQLHKQHHFPSSLQGPTLWWALLADLTGLTLVLWALTGLVMWWQIKPSRVLGTIAISAALVIAAVAMLRTHDHLTFGSSAAEAGP